MLCTLANRDDTRLAPINSPDNTIACRGIDIKLLSDDQPSLEQGEGYEVEILVKKQG
jgi:hypothetical protein